MVSFAVADLASGELLETHLPQLSLPPASVAKILTALYALDILGAEHEFQTKLVANGPVTNGVLDGDLVLVGGGDPTLDTNALAEMAAELKRAGVREVRGRFLVYGGALPRVQTIDPEQPDSAGYSPAISGLALNFNRVHFEWKRGAQGWALSMDARSDKYRPDVSMARMRVVERQVPVYTYASTPEADVWTVASGALGKGGARWLPVRLPELYAGDVFRTFARAQGVVLKPANVTQVRPVGTEIVSNSSQKLVEIIRGMLKYSTNITAEMVGLSATAARGVTALSLRDSAAEMNRWAAEKLGIPGTALVDHSGLGADSRMLAAPLAKGLAVADRHSVLGPLLKQIEMRKPDGKPDMSHPVSVHAKTGTLNFVSALAGYMKGPDGRDLAFAIFCADEAARAQISRADRIRPKGARPWNRKAKALQQQLIERWGNLYGA